MHYLTRITSVIAIIFITISAAAQKPTQQPDSLIHPFDSREGVEIFLRGAKIIKRKGTPVGITNPWRLTLDDGQIEHDALFKYIDDRKMGIERLADGRKEFDFKDSWKFEVAAYEIDKLLSLNMVPVTVERSYLGKKGSLQFWLNGMPESERKKNNIEPPVPYKWNFQMYKVWIFDKLIYNIDRNLTNLIVTPDWKCVMIDHSRCFKSIGGVEDIKGLKIFSRSLMKALTELDESTVNEKCGKWLTKDEISTMMKRRDILVEHYEKLFEEKGNSILCP